MNITNLFSWHYWFSQPFMARGVALWILVCGFLFFIIAGLVLKIIAQYVGAKPAKTLLRRFSTLGVVMGFLGLIWMFFRQERVAFLGWRFWWLVWLGFLAWWVIRTGYYIFKRLPQLKMEQEKKERIEKYLPRGGK